MEQTNTIREPIIYPTNLPYDDGIPLETPLHRENMNVLIDSAEQIMGERNDYFAGGNMFLYYSPKEVKNEDFRGPDFFLVKGVDGNKERKSWILWEEDWKYPNIIVELLSESTYKIDYGFKKDLYEQTFKTPEYFVYDPLIPKNYQGWRLNEYGFYVELEKNEEGWLWSEELASWLGMWTGIMKHKEKTYLRMYDKQKNLVLLESEEALLEKMKEHNRAESERMKRLAEYNRAEKERTKRLAEYNRAEKERMEKEREHLEKAKLANKLRELGIDPDKL